jgi:phytanoyl-CoA dioxygenase PhyH
MLAGSPLSPEQVLSFAEHGYVVVPGCLAACETAALAKEVETAIRDAAGSEFDRRHSGGLNGHYVPLTRPDALVSSSLPIDPRLLGAARQLLGPDVVPDYGMSILYFGESEWHQDHRWPLPTVKFATYFAPLDDRSGALRFQPPPRPVPKGAGPACGEPCATRPGDMLAFSGHAWHASFGGRDRWSWAVNFLQVPRTSDERDALAEMLTVQTFWSGFDWSHRGYPFYGSTWKQRVREREPRVWDAMTELGVFSAAELGARPPPRQGKR